MQRKSFFFPIFFFLFLSIQQNILVAQEVIAKLQKADSLYLQRKYPKAEEIYRQVLFDEQQYTPAMLLKMAQLNELKQKPNFIETLYALNLYYFQLPDTRILEKIQAIAEEKHFKGYEISDLEYVASFYNQYKMILILISLLVLSGGVFYLYYRKKQGKRPLFRAMVLTLIMALFFWIHNYGLTYQKGILYQKALLMNAPSAGATCLGVISKGDCFQIIDKQDVWYKVRSKEENLEGYIRAGNFLVIQ